MQIAGAPGRICEQPERSSSSSRLTREQVVDRIIEINPTATAGFLAKFSGDALQDYLERLRVARQPRGRDSRWIRRAADPAILTREAED